MKTFFYPLLLAGIIYSTSANAQTDSTKESVHFKLGAFYNSALNYYGRVDSLHSSGFFPLAELWINDKFYINAAPVFVNNSAVSMDYAGTVATAGYQSTSKNKKWLSNFYVVKPFYEKSTQLVQSALKAQTAFTLSYLNKFVNVTGGADIKFSDNTDYGVTGGVDHIFRKEFDAKTILVIDPAVNVFAGTQRFTNTYLKKTQFLLFPPVEQQVSEEVQKFSVLSYEISAPVILILGKFQLIATPSYVIPQNLIVSEQGKEMFYATVGAKVIL